MKDIPMEELKERVINAMEIAGYHYIVIESEEDYLRVNGEMNLVAFVDWSDAADWLENALIDDPELCERIVEILHPDEPDKMTILVVEPKKEPYVKTIDSGLESLQHEVGGYIEAVYPFDDPVALIVNEEGKLIGLPLNRALYDDEGRLYDVTSGTMLVVGLGEESFTSLSPELMEKYKAVYQQPELFAKINGKICVLPLNSLPQKEEKQEDKAPKKTSVLARLQEKKEEASKINQGRQKPEKAKGKSPLEK